jgi:DNA repair photolyase
MYPCFPNKSGFGTTNLLHAQFAGRISDMKIIAVQKKSHILTPSSLPCLAKIPTINITAGCFHRCIYCYSRGYSNYPGDDTVEVFTNLAQKLADELARKRVLPKITYFCPSSDPFQPVEQVLHQSFEVMNLLLQRNIGIQFITKGIIPPRFIELFARHKALVCGQIGISCIDDGIRQIFEPFTAAIPDRLETLKILNGLGITVSARPDPLICGITDSDSQINELFSAITQAGCKQVSVSYLFLRPAIRRSLEAGIRNRELLVKLLTPFRNAPVITMGTNNSAGTVLPKQLRVESFKRIRNLADKFGITVHICGCMNNDAFSESCNIVMTDTYNEPLLFDKF